MQLILFVLLIALLALLFAPYYVGGAYLIFALAIIAVVLLWGRV